MNKIMIIGAIFLAWNISAMELKKTDKEIVPLQGNELVLQLIVTHYLFDHESACALAATDKYNNKLMLTTAPIRKEKLWYRLVDPCDVYKLEHKYGSARCVAYTSLDDKNRLTLHYRELDNGKPKIESKVFYHFQSLPHRPAIFFNEEEKMCLYGQGFIRIPCKDKDSNGFCLDHHVVRYCLDGSVLACFLEKQKILKEIYSVNIIGLKYSLPYTSLLKAIEERITLDWAAERYKEQKLQ